MTVIKLLIKFCNLVTGLTTVILVPYCDDWHQPIIKKKHWWLVWYWSSRYMVLYLNDWFHTSHWGALMINVKCWSSRLVPQWAVLNWSPRCALDDWGESSHQGLYPNVHFIIGNWGTNLVDKYWSSHWVFPQWLVQNLWLRFLPWWPIMNWSSRYRHWWINCWYLI